MTTTPAHAAPWTWRRFVSCLFGSTSQRRTVRTDVMTGREAAARSLFSGAVHGSKLDLLNYDNSPYLQSFWLGVADRRIEAARDADRHVAAWHGKTPEQWEQFPALAKRDMRDSYAKAKGMAA